MNILKINLSYVLYILLLIVISISTLMYFRFNDTINNINRDLFHVHVENVKYISLEVENTLKRKYEHFTIDTYLKDLEYQEILNKKLASLNSSIYNEIYLLSVPLSGDINFKVLSYGDNFDEYEVYDDFEPLSENWLEVIKKRKPHYFQNGSGGTWFTYQYPIIQNGNLIAIFSMNFSIENYLHIANSLSSLEIFFGDYSKVMMLFFSILIIIVIIHLKLERQRVQLIKKLKTSKKKVSLLNKSMENTILSRTKELNKAKIKMETYMSIVDKYVISSTTDKYGKITYISKAFSELTGYNKEELIGKTHSVLKSKKMKTSIYDDLLTTIQNKKLWQGELCNLTKDGEEYWISNSISPIFTKKGNIKEYASIAENITDKKRIEKISVTDKLTQVYNRVKIDDIFIKEIDKAQRYGSIFSVILIDIDYFKHINDSYGHNVGDVFLKEFSGLLKSFIRKNDRLGRWGGEEFIIITCENTVDKLIQFAEKLRIQIENHDFHIVKHKTISLGLSMYQKNDTQEKMIGRADEGLYKAKNEGRNKVCFI